MKDLSESKKTKLMEEATAEFPDDEMMREIHYVRLIHHHQTKDLSARDRVRFYQQAKRRVAPKQRPIKRVTAA